MQITTNSVCCHRRFVRFLSISSVSSLLEDWWKYLWVRRKLKNILWFPHAIINGLWLDIDPASRDLQFVFAISRFKNISIFFFHFRMSWTSQRSTERPCLPYQQKRNGRYTAARRRLELSCIRSLCVWVGG